MRVCDKPPAITILTLMAAPCPPRPAPHATALPTGHTNAPRHPRPSIRRGRRRKPPPSSLPSYGRKGWPARVRAFRMEIDRPPTGWGGSPSLTARGSWRLGSSRPGTCMKQGCAWRVSGPHAAPQGRGKGQQERESQRDLDRKVGRTRPPTENGHDGGAGGPCCCCVRSRGAAAVADG